jgi:hypothetical protein
MSNNALSVRPSALPDIGSAALPANYERAKAVLAICTQIDECKDWADKAAALASYAKQADDPTLRNYATRISARAVRRCGELLQQFQTGPQGGRPKGNTTGGHGVSQRAAADAAGISPHQELQAVRVANVPVDDFELLVESDAPPTVTALAEIGTHTRPKDAPTKFSEATHILGVLHELTMFCNEHDSALVARAILAHEVAPVRATAATVTTWLAAFLNQLPEASC